MHVIPMTREQPQESIGVASASSSWIVAAILGAVLISELLSNADKLLTLATTVTASEGDH